MRRVPLYSSNYVGVGESTLFTWQPVKFDGKASCTKPLNICCKMLKSNSLIITPPSCCTMQRLFIHT